MGGTRNTTAGDGYYVLEVDLDGNGTFDTDRRFYRLLGDVNGDRQVSDADVAAVDRAILSGIYVPNVDVNGDGVLNIIDHTLASRSKGRKLADGLKL